MSDAPLKQIGKYQLTDRLGEGAMGVVYRAFDSVLNRHVAIKLMSAGIGADAELRDRFLREARAAGSLQHPNIITIYDFGEVEGHLFIAMEYVEGADLSEIIDRRDPLPLAVKLGFVIDVLHGLEYAHSRGVIHRDIKPANIRVAMDGRARIMDFGIARVEAGTHLTKTGMLIGTPNYMAPEQITGGAIAPATDIFAVGTLLYEFLSYTQTFGGDTLHQVLYKVVSEEPVPLPQVAPGLPPALYAIVAKSLAKDPAERFTSASAMARELAAVRTAFGASEEQATVFGRKTPLVTLAGTRLAKRPSRRGLWIGAGGGALAVVALLVLVLGPWRGPPPAPAPVLPTEVGTAPAPGSALPVPATTRAPLAPAAASPGPARAAAAPTPTAPQTRAAPTPAPTQAATPPAPTQQPVAPSPTQPAAPPAAAPVTQPATPTAEPADPRAEIEDAVAAYARAIESRSVAEIRHAYPGLTAGQARGWNDFFPTVRNLRVRLGVGRLDVSGATAEAGVSGTYEYENASTSRTERQPVSFRVTLSRDAGGWRIAAVR